MLWPKIEIKTKIENRNKKFLLSYLGGLLPFMMASFLTSGFKQQPEFAAGPFRLIDPFLLTYIEFQYCRDMSLIEDTLRVIKESKTYQQLLTTAL